jgi:hypothetical protein
VKYIFEMGTGAMIYIQSFKKIDSDIQKLIGGKLIILVLFFKIRKVGSKY